MCKCVFPGSRIFFLGLESISTRDLVFSAVWMSLHVRGSVRRHESLDWS